MLKYKFKNINGKIKTRIGKAMDDDTRRLRKQFPKIQVRIEVR